MHINFSFDNLKGKETTWELSYRWGSINELWECGLDWNGSG